MMALCYNILYFSTHDNEEYFHVVEASSSDEAAERIENLARINEDEIKIIEVDGPYLLLKYPVKAIIQEIK